MFPKILYDKLLLFDKTRREKKSFLSHCIAL